MAQIGLLRNQPSVGPAGPPSEVCTVATKPAASARAAGSLIFVTDDRGGTLFRTNGTAWVQVGASVSEPGGRVLGVTTLGANFAITSGAASALMDVPGMSITFTAGTRPITVRAEASQKNNGSTSISRNIGIFLVEGATVLQAQTVTATTTSLAERVIVSYTLTPSAGSHTYKMQVSRPPTSDETLTTYLGVPSFGVGHAQLTVIEG